MPPPSAVPPVAIDVEPVDAGRALYLHMAPAERSHAAQGQSNVWLVLRNNRPDPVRIVSIQVRVLPQQHSLTFITDWTLAVGSSGTWTQGNDLIFDFAPSSELEITVRLDGHDPVQKTLPLVPFYSPTDGYRFWGKVHDLRPGEFWHLQGTAHAQVNPAQLYAYDVAVGSFDAISAYGNTHLLPGGVSEKNDDHRIWGKPIYSVSDGEVTDFRNDFPTNEVAGTIDPAIAKFWTPVAEGGDGEDGNGNFVVASGNGESVTYAHMQAGSINRALRRRGAPVRKGDFIGLVGNSGSSGGPHLHIHSNVQNGGPTFWVGEPRPMTFRGARAVRWVAIRNGAEAAPWVRLDNRGFPKGDCAVWPSEQPVVDLIAVRARHLAINAAGHVWIVSKGTSWVHTTSERLPARGILLDRHPGGSGSEIAVFGDKPYVIGDDARLWEGMRDGWKPVPGSRLLRHLTVDVASGRVWVIDQDAQVWSMPSPGTWVRHAGNKRAAHLCVAAGVPHIAAASDNTLWRSAGADGWAPLAGGSKARRLAANPADGRLWVIDLDGNVHSRRSDGTWRTHAHSAGAKEIALHDGVPYVVGTGDILYKSEGAYGWLRLNTVATRK